VYAVRAEFKLETSLDLRLINDFMDIIILKLIRKNSGSNGYKLSKLVHRDYNLLVSAGTIYSVVYSLERHGFIKGCQEGRGRGYKLTKEGENFFSKISMGNELNHTIFNSIFNNL
jgi:DNA-binding PadR family transcriptional regulator